MIAIEWMYHMPEHCAECKFCLKQKTNDYGFFGECLLQEDKTVNCLAWSRDENCPLTTAVKKEKILDFIEDNRPTDIQTDWERGAAYICDEIEKIVKGGLRRMTIDEAIQHYEKVAEELDMKAGFETDNERYAMSESERKQYKECANDHRQLANWLKELRAYRKIYHKEAESEVSK